jgi:hypothetical protein
MLADGAVKARQPIWLTDCMNIFGLETLSRLSGEYEVSGLKKPSTSRIASAVRLIWIT